MLIMIRMVVIPLTTSLDQIHNYLPSICHSDMFNPLSHKGPSMLAAMTFGNCGYSLPAAMGAKVAAPHRNCVAYIGDGAWGMQLNEVGYCWFFAHSFKKII